MDKNLNVENGLADSSVIQEKKSNKFKLSWPLFKRTDFPIFINGFRTILRSKIFIIGTPIYLAALILWAALTVFSNWFTSFGLSFGIPLLTVLTFYSFIGMGFILIFNMSTLIRFFNEQKQNGIFSLELRKGKNSFILFSQRILVNKIFTLAYIALAVIIFYIFFSFASNPVDKHILINLYAPGLWTLLAFDAFVTAVVILFSSILKRGRIISTITMLISMFFWIWHIAIGNILGLLINFAPKPKLDGVDAQLVVSYEGQVTSHYAKEVNKIRYKFADGILDSMVKGKSELSAFGKLAQNEWVSNTSEGEVARNKRLNFEQLNTQLLFNGLIPDSKTLLSDLGVLEINNEGNSVKTKYNLSTDASAIKDTYFNNFFTSKDNLFVGKGQSGYSYQEWQKTIFNATFDLDAYKKDGSLKDLKQEVGDAKAAINYLMQAIKDVKENLTGKEKEEWNELAPIIVDAFKIIYINDKNGAWNSHSYLNRKSIFDLTNNADEKFNFGTSVSLDNKDKNVPWAYPVFTVDKDAQKYQDAELANLQNDIFKKLTVKPGTRQLISIMASLVSNSILIPETVSIHVPGATPNPGEVEGTNQEIPGTEAEKRDFIVKSIKYEQNLTLYNPYKWIGQMFGNVKVNPSFNDRMLIETTSPNNAFDGMPITSAITSKTYYNQSVKFNSKTKKQASGLINLVDDNDVLNPNFNWEDIKTVNSAFSPAGALVGILLLNIGLIGVAYWVFKRTLIQ